MPTSRRGQETVAWAAANPSAKGRTRSGSWLGYCLAFVRYCFGDVRAQGGSAASAWRAARRKHPNEPPPIGVPVFWTGGKKGYGHVALSCGDGTAWTTDYAGRGKLSRPKISDITRWLGKAHRYVGWSEDLWGVQVYMPAAEPEWRLECAIVDAWGKVVASGKPGEPLNAAAGAGKFVPSTEAAEPFRGVWRRVPA